MQNAGFIAITQEDYEKSPKALQEFLEKFFTKEKIFGVPCWVAVQTLSSCVVYGSSKGVAPTHSVDINHFGKSVAEGGLKGEPLYQVLCNLEEQTEACFRSRVPGMTDVPAPAISTNSHA